jgi:hypothetical protein
MSAARLTTPKPTIARQGDHRGRVSASPVTRSPYAGRAAAGNSGRVHGRR